MGPSWQIQWGRRSSSILKPTSGLCAARTASAPPRLPLAAAADSHIHLDLIERANNYKICEWDVVDVADTTALAAKKAAAAAARIQASGGEAIDIALPRPRPVVNTRVSRLPRHRREHFRDPVRGPLFSLIAPLLKYTH